MSQENKNKISEYMGVQPIMINSSLVSAQHRRRLYWTNIPNIKQPQDKNIYLKDILEKNIDEKFYISNEMKKYILGGGTKNYFHKPTLNPKKAYTCLCRYGYRAGISTYITDDLNLSNEYIVENYKNLKIRRLTPVEYERLQTLPDNYTEGLSKTQRYKCVGNGWTVDIITHIFNNLKKAIDK